MEELASYVYESDEVMEAADVEEPTNVDNSETSAQYSAAMNVVEPATSGVSSVTNARRKLARQALQFGRQVIENRSTADEMLDVNMIIHNCIHSAITMLKDKDSCRERKTSRLQMLLSLLSPEQPGTELFVIVPCAGSGVNAPLIYFVICAVCRLFVCLFVFFT